MLCWLWRILSLIMLIFGFFMVNCPALFMQQPPEQRAAVGSHLWNNWPCPLSVLSSATTAEARDWEEMWPAIGFNSRPSRPGNENLMLGLVTTFEINVGAIDFEPPPKWMCSPRATFTPPHGTTAGGSSPDRLCAPRWRCLARERAAAVSQKYSLHAALAAAAARGSVGARALPRFVIGMRVSVGVGWGGGKGLVGPITAEISNEHTHTHIRVQLYVTVSFLFFFNYRH